MSTQLDAILSQRADDGCPTSREFKRELVIRLKRDQFQRRLLGEFRRVHGRTAA